MFSTLYRRQDGGCAWGEDAASPDKKQAVGYAGAARDGRGEAARASSRGGTAGFVVPGAGSVREVARARSPGGAGTGDGSRGAVYVDLVGNARDETAPASCHGGAVGVVFPGAGSVREVGNREAAGACGAGGSRDDFATPGGSGFKGFAPGNGWTQDEGASQHLALDIGGRPRGDRGVLIHDLQMLSVERTMEALEREPGLITEFRLDSFAADDLQLENLLKILAIKKVRNVLVVNRAWPTRILDFPIDCLDNSEVETVRMAFCKVPEACVFEMGSLKMLDLAHCVMETQALYEFVQRCTALESLHLGYFSENLRINSESLVTLQIWSSKMREVCVEYAPKLQNITVSALPKADMKQIIVAIKKSPAIRSILCNIWRVGDK